MRLFPSKSQWAKWALPSKYSLWGLILTIVGLALTIVSLIPLIWSFLLSKPNFGRPNDPFTPILKNARSEIRSNIQCIDSYRYQLESDADWPVCRMTHSNLDRLFQNKFFVMGKNAYGEDNTLIWQWKALDTTIDRLNKARKTTDLREIEPKLELSFRDIYSIQAFLLWYTGEYAHEYLGEPFDVLDQRPSFYTGIDDRLWDNWPARATVDYDKKRVRDFGDWLGLLD